MPFLSRHHTSTVNPAPTTALITLQDVARAYETGRGPLLALQATTLTIAAGETVAIIGPSGSGKSTLLNLIAGIDRPTSGQLLIGGVDLTALSEERLTRWRGDHVGIVFQFFQLMPTLSALENILLAGEFGSRRFRASERRQRALTLLDQVGLADLADHLPAELSGGEQQRVALARALINDPPLLLADEPTGNLDSTTGERIMALLAEFASTSRTLIYVTHDPLLAAQARRTIHVRDGAIVDDQQSTTAIPAPAATGESTTANAIAAEG